METTTLAGRITSRIGFGCGRLAGGSETQASIRLIEAARMLGITHFDVAPSYGLGLAEDVLGAALLNDQTVTITTKVGIARPAYSGVKSLARRLIRPILKPFPTFRNRLARTAGASIRGKFHPDQVERSVEESLQRLRRDQVDVLLLHEPGPESITPELSATIDRMAAQGIIREKGSGTGGDWRALIKYGSVRQFRWTCEAIYEPSGVDITHGLLRQYKTPCTHTEHIKRELKELGFDFDDPAGWPGFLLTVGLCCAPTSIVLVSSTDASRLQAAVSAINWQATNGGHRNFLQRAVPLLRYAEGTSQS